MEISSIKRWEKGNIVLDAFHSGLLGVASYLHSFEVKRSVKSTTERCRTR